jgi:hypothetical protein
MPGSRYEGSMRGERGYFNKEGLVFPCPYQAVGMTRKNIGKIIFRGIAEMPQFSVVVDIVIEIPIAVSGHKPI